MEPIPPADQENLFQNEMGQLQSFYDAEANPLTPEEEEDLLPILNSLNEQTDRYEDIEVIAIGGEKKISRVFDHRLKRQVAMARAVNASTRFDQEEFLREAHLEAHLAHPNIMPVHNMGLDDQGVPFFTMELVPGDNLDQIIKKLKQGDETYRKAFPRDRLLTIYLKICDAIAYAHSHGVLHLDIKPSNIQVGSFGEVIVGDWGVAKVYEQASAEYIETRDMLDGNLLNDLTLTGTIKGSPGYMAPEQTTATGEKSPETDIYALGALLYELLSYELPTGGLSKNDLLENTRKGKLIPLHTRKPGHKIPKGLAAVAMKALSLNPERRYSSVQALQKEITAFLSGYSTTAEKAGPLTLLTLLIKRHNRTASLLLIFLIILSVIVSGALVSINRGKTMAQRAQQQSEENFRLFREQLDQTEQLDAELGHSIRVASLDYNLNTVQMISLLEAGLKKETNEKERLKLLLHQGSLHFVLEEFNAANACFKKIESALPPRFIMLEELTETYAKNKPDDDRLLTPAELTELLTTGKRSSREIEHLYYHHMRRTTISNPSDYLPVVKVMLERVNRSNTPNAPLKYTVSPEGRHLDLSGTQYYRFTLSDIGLYQVNILSPLKFNSLDISRTPFVDPSELAQLKIDELTMQGLTIHRNGLLLNNLKKMGVKKLTVDQGALSPAFAREVRKHLELIEIDPAKE